MTVLSVFRFFILTGSYAHDMGTNLSTLVNLSADNWAQHMTAAATHSHHLPTAASMLSATGPLTTSTGVVHHHQPQYHPASVWNLNAATSPSCAMSQYLRSGAGYLPTTPETPGSSSSSTTSVGVGVGVSSATSSPADLHNHTHTHTTPPSAVSFPSAVVDTTSALLTPHSTTHHHSLVSADSVAFNSPIRDVKTAVGSWSPLTPPSQ